MYEPEQVCDHVFLPPERSAPFSACHGDFASKVVVTSLSIAVTAEEKQGVVEVWEVNLNGCVVYPWLDAICEPKEYIIFLSIKKIREKGGLLLTILDKSLIWIPMHWK